LRREEKEDDEASIMSQISLVIHSVFVLPEFTFHERQEQQYSLQSSRPGLAGHPPAHPGKHKFSVG